MSRREEIYRLRNGLMQARADGWVFVQARRISGGSFWLHVATGERARSLAEALVWSEGMRDIFQRLGYGSPRVAYQEMSQPDWREAANG